MNKSAFNDNFLEPFEEARAILVAECINDPDGFYRAEAHLRIEYGLLLTPENEQAVLDGIRGQEL